MIKHSFVVNKIGQENPIDDGQYVGFKNVIESSEIDFSQFGMDRYLQMQIFLPF